MRKTNALMYKKKFSLEWYFRGKCCSSLFFIKKKEADAAFVFSALSYTVVSALHFWLTVNSKKKLLIILYIEKIKPSPIVFW